MIIKNKMMIVLSGLFIMAVFVVVYLYISISWFGNSIKPKDSDVIIILGAAVWGDEPSPVLRERCDWAFKIYEEGYAKEMILSGGHGNGNISEAQAMKNYLMEKGVPENALHVEGKSRSTIENIGFSTEIMTEMGFDSAIIITNQFHLKRAVYHAEELSNYDFTGYGEKTTYLNEPYFTLREVGGFLNEFSKKFTGVYSD